MPIAQHNRITLHIIWPLLTKFLWQHSSLGLGQKLVLVTNGVGQFLCYWYVSFESSAEVELWPRNAIWSDCLTRREYVSVSAEEGGLREFGGGVTPSDEGMAAVLMGGPQLSWQNS